MKGHLIRHLAVFNEIHANRAIDRAALAVFLFLVLWNGQIEARHVNLEDASGITRVGNALLIVGDKEAGVYYRYPLDGREGTIIPIDSDKTTRVTLPQANFAIDLEAIDVLANGQVVVLAEGSRALVGENGFVAKYGKALTEFGNRGLEGLAVRPLEDGSSRIAVLWEGGYPEYKDVPAQLRKRVGRLPMRPVVWVHDVKPGETGMSIRADSARVVELDPPKPAGKEPHAQRFRAPDLVWYRAEKENWGFIVLLNSQNSPETGNPAYTYLWLQQFTMDGQPFGKPFDLKTVMPANLKEANWEGLGWFEKNKSLVLIYDKPPKGQPTALVVDLPEEWKSSD